MAVIRLDTSAPCRADPCRGADVPGYFAAGARRWPPVRSLIVVAGELTSIAVEDRGDTLGLRPGERQVVRRFEPRRYPDLVEVERTAAIRTLP